MQKSYKVIGASIAFSIILISSVIVFYILTYPSNNNPTNEKPTSEILWQKMFGGSGQDWAYSISETMDGGIILAGVTNSLDLQNCENYGGEDIYVLKLFSNGTLEWQKTFGGNGNDYAYVVQQAQDGGYFIIGESNSTNLAGTTALGGYDALIIKLNALGELEWQRLVGGNDYDNLIASTLTSDGGVIFAGESRSTNIDNGTNNGKSDVFVYKLSENGEFEWQQLYGGVGIDRALSIKETLDGNFILVGSSTSNFEIATEKADYDFYLLKISFTGDFLWQKQYGGSSLEWGFDIVQTSDEGFILCGLSASTDIPGTENKGKWDVYVIKVDTIGSIQWQQLFGGSNDDLVYKIQETDGGFLLCGGSWSKDISNSTNNGGRDYYLLKIDQTGNILWQKQYGGKGTDYASSFIQKPDGEIIIAGGSDSKNIPDTINKGKWDIYVIKLSANFQ